MCIVKTPQIPDPAKDSSSTATTPPLPILRNPILDGMLGNIAALRAGTSAFRIDLLNPLRIPGGGSPGGAGGSSRGSGSSSSSSSSSSGSSGSSSSSSGSRTSADNPRGSNGVYL